MLLGDVVEIYVGDGIVRAESQVQVEIFRPI